MQSDEESEEQQCTAPEPSRADLDADAAVSSSEGAMFSFKIGSRVMSAIGTPCSAYHTNIYRLEIPCKWYHQLLGWVLGKLPRSLQDWLRAARPEWVLPPVVALKIQKPDWDAEFDQEKEAYTILRPLQGLHVPVYYGEVRCSVGKEWQDGAQARRGHVLSYLEGSDLLGDKCPDLEIAEVKERLQRCFRAVAELGVAHDDVKMQNVMLVGDRAMLVDWEMFHRPMPEDMDLIVESEVTFLTEGYEDVQKARRAGL